VTRATTPLCAGAQFWRRLDHPSGTWRTLLDMVEASRTSLSKPLAILTPKTASGGKIRASRFAPKKCAHKQQYRFGDTLQANLPGIIAGSVGNFLADRIAGTKASADPTKAAQQSGSAGSSAAASGGAEPLTADIVVTASRLSREINWGAVYGYASRFGGGGNSGTLPLRPFFVDSGPGGATIATGPKATQMVAFPSGAQSEWASWLSGPGKTGMAADFAAEEQVLTSRYLPAGYAAASADSWEPFVKAYQSGGPVDPVLRYPVESDVSLLSQLDGRFVTSAAGSFTLNLANAGSEASRIFRRRFRLSHATISRFSRVA